MSWSNRRSDASKAHKKLIDSPRWRKYRKRYLRDNPTCVICGIRPSQHVDHIKEPGNDTRLFWRESNHQALCQPCHNSKTHADKSGKPMKGCNEWGEPLDSSHPWYS